ncbi:hypothetical protein KQ51_00280 [Candidatus Izimaplasma bacterium HR1]|jgi:hypothetical protein|uniref:hypothetical protein n=1 Tax=Candidatus Izimoplasma sp. HR1 TaxID=1541959 RepID=UPI0004F63D1D|nr:hypothetical protein KQ51_00280 [Candidatus Izimaplasma bacterium HR1]
MEKESLLYFKSPKELSNFISELNVYNGWKIQEGIMNERGKLIEDKIYTRMLRELFREKNFFRRNVSLAEIISWLDNLTLIQRLLNKLEVAIPSGKFNDLEISVEYMIQMSKRMRVDYVIIYKKNILLLELRTVSSFNKVRPTWEKKFHELLIYKELMSYYIKDFDIKCYALIPLYEYSNKIRKEKHIDNNDKQLDYLVEYISRYIIT